MKTTTTFLLLLFTLSLSARSRADDWEWDIEGIESSAYCAAGIEVDGEIVGFDIDHTGTTTGNFLYNGTVAQARFEHDPGTNISDISSIGGGSYEDLLVYHSCYAWANRTHAGTTEITGARAVAESSAHGRFDAWPEAQLTGVAKAKIIFQPDIGSPMHTGIEPQQVSSQTMLAIAGNSRIKATWVAKDQAWRILGFVIKYRNGENTIVEIDRTIPGLRSISELSFDCSQLIAEGDHFQVYAGVNSENGEEHNMITSWLSGTPSFSQDRFMVQVMLDKDID